MAHAVRYGCAPMSPFSRFGQSHTSRSGFARKACSGKDSCNRLRRLVIFCVLAIPLPGCGNTSSNATNPSVVVVSIQPTSASPFLGEAQQFQATVAGAANTSVTWEVNGVTGGSAAAGTISTAGLYTAPEEIPSPATVIVEAVSNADPQVSASASVALMDNIIVSVTPNPASVAAGGAQVFTATVTGAGNAATGVNWSVNAIPGGNATVGT